MANETANTIGTITWRDLTVENADQVRAFYEAVVGWKSQPEDMGGYSDYYMSTPESGETTAGICHARGSNANLPAQWLIYITVASVEASAAKCVELGGQILTPPRSIGNGSFCVIRDPSGAVCALTDTASS